MTSSIDAFFVDFNPHIKTPRTEVFCEKGVLGNFAKFTGKHLCQNLFINKVAGLFNFIKKETLAQVLSCEFCKISKNTFSYRTLPLAASDACVYEHKSKCPNMTHCL